MHLVADATKFQTAASASPVTLPSGFFFNPISVFPAFSVAAVPWPSSETLEFHGGRVALCLSQGQGWACLSRASELQDGGLGLAIPNQRPALIGRGKKFRSTGFAPGSE